MKRKLSAWLVIVMLLTAVLPINMLAEEEIYVDDTAIETFDDVEEVEAEETVIVVRELALAMI